jgi:hypothetical protein
MFSSPPDDIIWHAYRPAGLLARIVRSLWVAVCLGVPLVLLIGSLFVPVAGLVLLITLPLLAAAAAPFAGLLIVTADIGLGPDGITLRLLGPIALHLPWEQLRHASVWQTPAPVSVRWALLRRWATVHAAYVPGRRLLIPAGLLLGFGRLPVLVITPDHQDVPAIIRRLEHLHHPLTEATRRAKGPRWRLPRPGGE